jgi:hypothetical protein
MSDHAAALDHEAEAGEGAEPIENLRISSLYCTVCRIEIEPSRARRQTATCGEKCKDQLDQVRILQRRDRKCPHCLHPSNNAEREEYRRWRASRGDRRHSEPARKDTSISNRRDLQRALKAAVALLEEERDLIAESGSVHDEDGKPDLATMDDQSRTGYDEKNAKIQGFKKLLDKPAEA